MLHEHTLLAFDRDLHAEARTVLEHSPQPQNLFEVAVILETAGYDDEAARLLGSDDVFELARRVSEVVDLYTEAAPVDVAEVPAEIPAIARRPRKLYRHLSAGLLARCLLYSVPWLFAIVALAVSRVSFWSTITTVQFSSAISLALFVALVLTGAFIQAFARRGTFYALQGNQPLLNWTTCWTLGAGAVVSAVVYGATYAVLEYGLRAYTPNSTKAYLFFGLSISAMLLALAPLFIARAFGFVSLATGAGAAFVSVGGRAITVGQFIDPYTAMKVQLGAISVVVVISLVLDVVVLRHAARPLDGPSPARVRRPRLAAAATSVSGYAAYGSCFFLLIIVDQLVAGGLWSGGFSYDNGYELAVGVGLLVLVPTLTYVAASNEVFAGAVQVALARYRVSEVAALREEMSRFYRRHLGALVAVGAASAGLLLLLGAYAAGAMSITSRLPTVYGVYAGALGAYLLLAVGAFNSGLLFSLARPGVPAAATATGAAFSLLLGGGLTAALPATWAALAGLLGGTAVFACWTTAAAHGVFSRFDASYYRAF